MVSSSALVNLSNISSLLSILHPILIQIGHPRREADSE